MGVAMERRIVVGLDDIQLIGLECRVKDDEGNPCRGKVLYSLDGRNEIRVIEQQTCPHCHRSQVNQTDVSPTLTKEIQLIRKLVELRNADHERLSKLILEIKAD